jgi:hypothetical protein
MLLIATSAISLFAIAVLLTAIWEDLQQKRRHRKARKELRARRDARWFYELIEEEGDV